MTVRLFNVTVDVSRMPCDSRQIDRNERLSRTALAAQYRNFHLTDRGFCREIRHENLPIKAVRL